MYIGGKDANTAAHAERRTIHGDSGPFRHRPNESSSINSTREQTPSSADGHDAKISTAAQRGEHQ